MLFQFLSYQMVLYFCSSFILELESLFGCREMLEKSWKIIQLWSYSLFLLFFIFCLLFKLKKLENRNFESWVILCVQN